MEASDEPLEGSDSENQPSNVHQDSFAEPPPAKRRALNLKDFFARFEKNDVEEDEYDVEIEEVPSPRAPLPRPTYNVFRHALERQVNPAQDPWAASHLRHAYAQAYRETAFLDGHPWRSPMLGSHAPLQPSGCVQCAQFDSTGELLVTGSIDGAVLVHSAPSLLEAAAAAPEGAAVKVEPLLAINSGLVKLNSVRWNPSNENVIGVSSSTSRAVHIYDLQHTQGRPTRILNLPVQSSGGIGAGDLAFFSSTAGGSGGNGSGGSYSVLVGGPGGQVFLWDSRCSGGPASTLQSLQPGPVTAVHLIDGDQAVIAGTQAGDVKIWDIRGGNGGALRFGGVVHHHPMLTCVGLRAALAEVPHLAEQAGGIPPCAVQSMVPDPQCPRRVGFHLGCGWSGVLDLPTRKITHVHAPPQPLVDEQPTPEDGARAIVMWAQMAAPTLRRRACWTPDGTRFVVPSRQHDAVALLDFAASTHAGCCAELPENDEMPRVPPSAASVKLSQAAICASAMPNSSMLVACGAHNFISLLNPS